MTPKCGSWGFHGSKIWIPWIQNVDPMDPKCGSCGFKMWIPWIQNMNPIYPKCGSCGSKCGFFRKFKCGSHDSKIWIPWIQNVDPMDPKCGSSTSKMWIHLKMSNNLEWCYYQNIQKHNHYTTTINVYILLLHFGSTGSTFWIHI